MSIVLVVCQLPHCGCARMRKPCSHYGCPNTVPLGTRWCPAHFRTWRNEIGAGPSVKDPARVRFNNSKFWKLTRERKLAEQPVCVVCGGPATDVDHIDGDWTNNRPTNLQAMCHSCHSKKTNRFDGGMFGSREPRPERKDIRWGRGRIR